VRDKKVVTVAEETSKPETTLVERWLAEQQEWQRTLLTYVDSMVKKDDFLVHLGNAMRGSLLAGKPYPTAGAPNASAPENAADDRLDRVLFALHELQGQVQDLRLALDELTSRENKRGKKDKSGKRKDPE
jgi:hypothetical protein